jgi:hypothetical protein
MNVFAHHEQAQPRNQIAYKSNSSKAQNKNNNNKPNQIKFIVISKNKVDLFKRIKGKNRGVLVIDNHQNYIHPDRELHI